MASGLVPAIHVLSLRCALKTWMPGTRPGHDDIQCGRTMTPPIYSAGLAGRVRGCRRRGLGGRAFFSTTFTDQIEPS